MRRSRLSDEEFIAWVRRWQRTRFIWGAVVLVVGIAMVVLGGVGMRDLSAKALELHRQWAELRDPSAEQMGAAFESSRFYNGLVIGSVTGVTLGSGFLAVIMGLQYLVGSDRRKDQILLDLWDKRSSDAQPAAGVSETPAGAGNGAPNHSGE